MRIWSIHPSYLDSKGLVALWREALLAQKVLLGKTKGYKHHPQLIRFRNTVNPVGAIASYLRSVADEATLRNYQFDRNKIISRRINSKITVTSGQVQFEFNHLLQKLRKREPALYKKLKSETNIKLHPLFVSVKGDVEEWEIT